MKTSEIEVKLRAMPDPSLAAGGRADAGGGQSVINARLVALWVGYSGLETWLQRRIMEDNERWAQSLYSRHFGGLRIKTR